MGVEGGGGVNWRDIKQGGWLSWKFGQKTEEVNVRRKRRMSEDTEKERKTVPCGVLAGGLAEVITACIDKN